MYDWFSGIFHQISSYIWNPMLPFTSDDNSAQVLASTQPKTLGKDPLMMLIIQTGWGKQVRISRDPSPMPWMGCKGMQISSQPYSIWREPCPYFYRVVKFVFGIYLHHKSKVSGAVFKKQTVRILPTSRSVLSLPSHSNSRWKCGWRPEPAVVHPLGTRCSI